ncbi:MAG: 4Fe-4S dicluster domain-containing protein [Pseudomonadota bacterium]|nr:MAG: 4Fe-4S dicluster domain-containing protein [Pseudomonadota bacterium]
MLVAPDLSLNSDILSGADKCVKCGLCHPGCPTYVLSLNENEAPRGRIALMQALAGGQLKPSPPVLTHLDHCLTCRACEHVCPSGVPFGALIDATRILLEPVRQRPRAARLLRRLALTLVRRPALRAVVTTLLRFYQQRPGLRARVAGSSFLARRPQLRRLESMLPSWHRKPAPASTTAEPRGRIALFAGCTGRVLEPAALDATRRVLTHLGYEVVTPRRQTCCGALHLHAGEREAALTLARHNLRVFAAARADAVIYTASGCGAQLREYDTLFAGEPKDNAAENLGVTPVGICEFLTGIPWPEAVTLRPLARRVAIHEPCSLRNVLRSEDAVYRLLGRIPQIRLEPLPDNALCCGAAGSYMLSEPQWADAIVDRKLARLAESDAVSPEIIVSSNVGCAVHLRNGLRRRGVEVEVMHPVELLCEQLEEASSEERGAR